MDITIDVNSINTNSEKRDDHLRSPDFFDVAQFPVITFVSDSIALDGDEYLAYGKLTMHGVTKDVVIPFEYIGVQESPFKQGLFVTSLVGEFDIKRSDYGMNYMEGIVGDELEIEISAELDQQR
jgi:polyisoprenoid-binding protein YceI